MMKSSNARKEAQQKLSKAKKADIEQERRSSLCSNSFRYRRISCIFIEKMIEKEIDANIQQNYLINSLLK